MKQYLFLLLIACAHLSSCNVPDQRVSHSPEWDKELTTEQNIAKQAMPFDSNSEFSFLDEIAKTRQVIILGEEGHYDLATTEAKINMVNYLKTKGFNSIALEAAPFLTCYVFSNPEYAELTRGWEIEQFWDFLWVSQKPCQPLLEMINDHEIKIFGIDTYLSLHDIRAAKLIFNKYFETDHLIIGIDWVRLSLLWQRFLNYGEYGDQSLLLSTEEKFEMMRIFDSISIYTQYLIAQKGELKDLKAIMQWIRNANTHFSFGNSYGGGHTDRDKLAFRSRDSQMVENILWITENFPEENFTVWCGNLHGAKDISQTMYPVDSLRYFVYQTMGEGMFSKLGGKMYSLAVTSLNNDFGKKAEDTGVLEQETAKYTNNAPFAFIDFEPLRFTKGYINKDFDCNVIIKKRGKWLYIFDGVYYIRDQKMNKVLLEQMDSKK